MFILKKGHQLGVYVPLRALFLVLDDFMPDVTNSYYSQNYVSTNL